MTTNKCGKSFFIFEIINNYIYLKQGDYQADSTLEMTRQASSSYSTKLPKHTRKKLENEKFFRVELSLAKYLADKIEAGLVHINGNDDNSAPFGGIKESGIGKDKSAFVFDEFSYQKAIWMHFGE